MPPKPFIKASCPLHTIETRKNVTSANELYGNVLAGAVKNLPGGTKPGSPRTGNPLFEDLNRIFSFLAIV